MDFIMIFGPQAVGKMTVGEELAKETGLKLFHNHMTIDLLLQLFTWDQMHEISSMLREEIFKKMASLPDERGMIFTYVWAFELESEWNYVNHIRDIFHEHNIYFVELIADLGTRLSRNKTENRLNKKWTKRDIVVNEYRMKETMVTHRTTSHPGEIPFPNYLRIDNTNLSAKAVADLIVTTFQLQTVRSER